MNKKNLKKSIFLLVQFYEKAVVFTGIIQIIRSEAYSDLINVYSF